MKIELFTLCDYAQENDGKLTLVGTFDTIIAREFPCTHPSLYIVVRLRYDLWEFGRHQFRIETRDLDGDQVMPPVTGTMEVRGVGNATAVSHIVFNLANARFKAPGVVSFTLYLDDRETASLPLYVRKG